MNIDVFYYGKLRDTVSLDDGIQAPIDFMENIKKKVFESSSEFARISSKPMMVAELRRWKENLYSVFTYFIPGQDTTGRLGGFVAVTSIIHGALPSERKKLFELYKLVHKKLIEFNVISENQQIKVDSFDVAKVELKKLSEEFVEDIKKRCGEMTDISSLTLNKKEENARQFNPEDINESGFVDSLADAGIAYVSSEFLTIAMIKQQQEAERRKQEEQKKKQEEQKKKELTDELVKLKDRLEKVESAVANQNKAGGKNNHGDGNHKDNSDVSSRDKLWLRIVMVLSLVNLILICLLFFFVRANLKELRDDEKKTSPKTETVKAPSSEEKQTGKMDQAAADNGQNNQNVNSQDDQAANQQNDPNAVQEKLNQITQSIEGSSGASLENAEVKPKFGKTYDVSIAVKCKGKEKEKFMKGDPVSVGDTLVLSVATSPKEGHEFFVRGAHFIGSNKKMAIVDDAESVTVWYCHKEDEKSSTQCNTRTYPIQKK